MSITPPSLERGIRGRLAVRHDGPNDRAVFFAKATVTTRAGSPVGFSVLVDASFDAAKQALERAISAPLRYCKTSDGMRSCELSIAEQRTVFLVTSNPPNDKKHFGWLLLFL